MEDIYAELSNEEFKEVCDDIIADDELMQQSVI